MGFSRTAAGHVSKNLALIILSIFLLPLDTLIALGAYLWPKALPSPQDATSSGPPHLGRKTVLVTGVNMAKGLTLARIFHRRGHRVIGADTHALSLGRVSRAVDAYYQLSPPPADGSRPGNDPYLNGLLDIAVREKADLWVSVSDVNAAIEDATAKEIIEARTNTKAIQLGVKDIQLLHEKHLFMNHCKTLGLPIPDTQVVRSREEVIAFFKRRGGLGLQPDGRQYLLKPIDVDDLARFSMPLLPMASEEATLERLATVPFPQTSTYILQEFISGPEYCTHALIIRGKVGAFVACPSEGVLMHYRALPSDSALSQAMLEFTKTVARAGGEEFTGHMSFDFLVKADDEGKEKDDIVLYPIECNPRVHTAIVLFNDTPDLVDEYLSVLSPPARRDSPEGGPLITAVNPRRYYWLGQDLIELVFQPLIDLLLFHGTTSFGQLRKSNMMFLNHVLHWKDGTFEAWDPWPWWWLHHVYWPVRFAGYLFTGSWQKLNVSTGKAFKAD